jgi:preprotein translocase subunit SecE
MRKITGFFKEVYAELRKVIWPSRMDTIRYTALVIGFSVALSVILGAADFGLLKGVEALLNK